MKAALFYIIVLSFDFNVSASVRIRRNGISSDRRQIQSRLLRSEQNEHMTGEELQMKNAPKEINVDPRSTYNDNFMALMRSPCRPEYDGFFGATSGDPIRIQYGFKVEVEPLSAIMEILETIEDKVVDSILQYSFPEMCGLRRTRKTEESFEALSKTMTEPGRSLAHVGGHPSGFRFLKFEEVDKCLPEENDVNFCGVFTGVLYVYGKHQHGEEASSAIMSHIREVLDTLEPHDLHSELVLLSSVDTFFFVEGDNIDYTSNSLGSSDGQLSRVGVLLIIISGLITLAIIYYINIQRNERRLLNSTSSADEILEGKHVAVHSPRGLSKYFGTRIKESSDNDGDEFIDEDLNFEPYRDGRDL